MKEKKSEKRGRKRQKAKQPTSLLCSISAVAQFPVKPQKYEEPKTKATDRI